MRAGARTHDMNLKLDQIRTDGGTQPREKLDSAVVAEYTEQMQAGDVFPPVSVVYDGTNYWLWDGFHRVNAALLAGRDEMAVACCNRHTLSLVKGLEKR